MRQFFTRRHRSAPRAEVIYDGALPEMPSRPGLEISARSTLVGENAGRARRLQGRIWLCLSVFILIFSGLAVRLVDITLINGTPHYIMTANTAEADRERPAITDRNGVSLAMNRHVTGLAIDTRSVWDARETADSLAAALPDLDADRIYARIQDRKYIVLRNELTAAERRKVMTLGLPGVDFPEGTRRVYPQGALAAHATGYTIAGRGGVAGLEYLADETRAKTLVSSLDVRAQQILEEEIRTAMDKFQVENAWGVILKAKTGEVVALSSMPGFNPNDVNNSPADHWRNRAMQDRYELGSAFKVLTAAAVLEEGVAAPSTLYDARQPLRMHGVTISDFHPRREIMSLSKVVQHSSNIGIAKAALQLGTERQQGYLKKLGLTEGLRTELPETREPGLPTRWGPVETATISYGHGIAVTPLQLTAAVAAVVNGGIYYEPTFLKTDGPREGTRVFSAETSGTMRMMMRQVITDGTSSFAEAAGYYPIGKTATAEKPGIGGYSKDRLISSFVGAFPGYDPEYVILVSFDEPVGNAESYGYATAGWVAAPAFGNIVARMGPVMGLPPARDDLAFDKFMSGLRSSDELILAMKSGDSVPEGEAGAPATELDDLARLLEQELDPKELGP